MGLVFGVIVYAGFAVYFDAKAILDQSQAFGFKTFGLALLLSCVNYLIRFGKWHYYLRILHLDVPPARSFIIFLAGMVMSVTPGKIGEVLKSLLLQQSDGIAPAKTAPVVIAERLTDMFGLVVIASVGIASFDFGRWAFVAIVGGLLIGVGVIASPSLVQRIIDGIGRFALFSKLVPKLREAYDSMRALVGLKALLIATVLSTISWSCEAFAFYMILDAMDAEITFRLAAFIYAMATLLGAVSFLPGGLGVTEGSMIGVLLGFGVFATQAPAAFATYLIRFATLWFGVGVGLVALVVFRRSMRKDLPGADS